MPKASPTTLVIEHYGKADPVTEGWIAAPTRALLETLNPIGGLTNFPALPAGVPDFPYAPKVHAGPAVDPDGTTSWFINDQATDPQHGGGGGYFYFISPTFQTQARDKGWILSFTLRVDHAAPDWPGRDISVFLNNWLEQKHYGVWFGLSAANATLVWIDGPGGTGVAVTDPALSTPGFHHYEIDYDPTTLLAVLTIDGGAPHSFSAIPWASTQLLPRSVVFGSASTGGTGRASYRHVKLVVKD